MISLTFTAVMSFLFNIQIRKQKIKTTSQKHNNILMSYNPETVTLLCTGGKVRLRLWGFLYKQFHNPQLFKYTLPKRELALNNFNLDIFSHNETQFCVIIDMFSFQRKLHMENIFKSTKNYLKVRIFMVTEPFRGL